MTAERLGDWFLLVSISIGLVLVLKAWRASR